ncbi:MAG: DUF1570 domain-containing protein [Planctomycetota bacterium]
MYRRTRRTLTLSLAGLSLLLPVYALAGGGSTTTTPQPASEPAPLPLLRVFETQHYRIHTNLPRGEAKPFGQHMDRLAEQYTRRFRELGQPPAAPLPLYLLATADDYRNLLQHFGINAANSGGMFFVTHHHHGLATFTHSPNHHHTLKTLQHEGFHQFVFSTLGTRVPTWLNEGLAQYFEDAVLVRDSMELGLASPQRIARIKRAIHSGQALPLNRLLTLTPRDWAHALRTDPAASSRIYAQAWSLVYFLIHGEDGRHLPALQRYLRELAAGAEPDTALKHAFGPAGLTALEPRWRTFALEHEPAPLDTALQRLHLLASAIRFAHDQPLPVSDNDPQPFDPTGEALRQRLGNLNFTLTQHHPHHPDARTLLAPDDPTLYRFPDPHTDTAPDRPFLFLEPDRLDLPPRITAPGLRPQPTLTWSRSRDGQLTHTLTFR